MPGPDQPRWLDRLTIDYDNIRAAIRWTIDAGEVELALRFVAATWRYWQQDGRLVEGTGLAQTALAMPGADAPTEPVSLPYRSGRARVLARPTGRRAPLVRGGARRGAPAREHRGRGGRDSGTCPRVGTSPRTPPARPSCCKRPRRLYEQIGDARGPARVEWSEVTGSEETIRHDRARRPWRSRARNSSGRGTPGTCSRRT